MTQRTTTRAAGTLTRRLVAVGLGIVGALIVAEVIARLAITPPAARVLRGIHRVAPGRPWLYEMEPGARRTAPDGVDYAIDGSGFRGAERTREKPAGTFRIALIGDSVTFGYGVAFEQTFGSQLDQRLRAGQPGTAYEVLNFGVSGYNPYTEAELLRGVVLEYAPDLVLVQFCINDLNDPTQHFDASTMLAIGDLPDAAFPDPAHRQAPHVPSLPEPLATACDASRLCTRIAGLLEAGRPPEEMLAALKPHDEPSAAELAWLEALYTSMARDARARGVALAVVVFPYKTQLERGGSDVVQRELSALGARAGIPVIDLLPAFRRAVASSDASALYLDMWHPTARGHAVASDELFRALACAKLLPGVAAGADCARAAG